MEDFKEKLKSNKTTYKIGVLVKVFYYNLLFQFIRFIIKSFNQFISKPKKFKQIEKFKNKHLNERCFIVATGPSLTFEDLELIKDEISFGVNSIVKILSETNWRPTYFGIQDPLVYEKLENDILNSDAHTIFTSDLMQKKFASTKNFIPFFHDTCFHAVHGEIMPLCSGFSNDASVVIYDGYSITYSMLQIAVYMGFKEIYLLGTDCNYNIDGTHHFVESGFYDKQAATVGQRMIFAYSVAKKYSEMNDIKIYNCTRGGMLEVFERKDLNSVVKNIK